MLTQSLLLDSTIITEYDDILPVAPNIEHLITEDDTPVDNMFSAKQQRLLVEPLYSSWQSSHPFLADANVGIFYSVHQPAIVPDMFLSLDVFPPTNWWAKYGRSYFMWEFGKPPEVVIEIVSNNKGGEADNKLRLYAQLGVAYYVIFDPIQQIQTDTLRIYQLKTGRYQRMSKSWLSLVGLGLTLWPGVYEGGEATWLRWCDQAGQPIPTGADLATKATYLAKQAQERAEQESQRAEQESQRAEQERQRANQEQARALTLEQELEAERQRMQLLLSQLAAQGINPDQLK
jgi:Uma2 family endonuclease